MRELRNLVERLVIMCPSPRIEPHHLPPELFRGASKSPQKPYESLQEARSAYEREFVLRKLEENRWNMTKTADGAGARAQPPVSQDALAGHRAVESVLEDLRAAFLAGELLELAVPIELADDCRILAPVRLHLDEQFEKNVRVENRLELLARLRADFLHRLAALADENSLLPFPLDVKRRADSDQLARLFEAVQQHGDGVRYFLARRQNGLLADDLGGEKSLGLVGELIRGK